MGRNMRKKFGIILLIIIGVFLLDRAMNNYEENSRVDTCDQLAPHIVELSKERDDSLQPKILKLYDIKEESHRDRELNCIATARWSRGNKSQIVFYRFRDKDGDSFIGYKSLY